MSISQTIVKPIHQTVLRVCVMCLFTKHYVFVRTNITVMIAYLFCVKAITIIALLFEGHWQAIFISKNLQFRQYEGKT